jgi:hypothetical protein
MKTKIQIKTPFGKLLFEFEKEDNSIKETLIEGVKRGVDLRGADLRGADLRDAYLRGADLRGAYLRGADLRGADLRDADLRGADLRDAYLRGADLRGADLRGADLRDADLKKLTALHTIVPEGELIVWKKLRDNLLARLLIPAKAKRVNAIGYRKCRFEFAQVLVIYDGKKKVKEGISKQHSDFIYRVGEIVIPDSFDPSPFVECSHGISAFISKQEAIDY